MYYLYGFDWTYLVLILPCVLISAFCQFRVKSAFSKYSKVPNSRNMTGAQAAEYVLRHNGVTGVTIEHVAGSLTDHFDPRSNTIRLSDTVYGTRQVTLFSTLSSICRTRYAALYCRSRISAPS